MGLGLEKCGILSRAQHGNINSTVVFWQKAESNAVKLFPPHLSRACWARLGRKSLAREMLYGHRSVA